MLEWQIERKNKNMNKNMNKRLSWVSMNGVWLYSSYSISPLFLLPYGVSFLCFVKHTHTIVRVSHTHFANEIDYYFIYLFYLYRLKWANKSITLFRFALLLWELTFK